MSYAHFVSNYQFFVWVKTYCSFFGKYKPQQAINKQGIVVLFSIYIYVEDFHIELLTLTFSQINRFQYFVISHYL